MLFSRVLLCRPDYFQVTYQINPWMRVGASSLVVAQDQWHRLVDVYLNLGLDVTIVPQQPEFPDMVFAADQGIPCHSQFLLSNFRYPQRQAEPQYFHTALELIGYNIMALAPEIICEGEAEATWFNNFLLYGYGFRSDVESPAQIAHLFDIEVIPLQLINPYFYHMDLALFVLDDQTVCYYPPAFSLDSQALLKRLIPKLIYLTEWDALKFAGNSLAVQDQVILPVGCRHLPNQLREHGFHPIEVDVSEFKTVGGDIHCLTLCLD
jgi:N-dimethylarginine dimethylaminohydrolase